jgi:hypothetical protein
MVGQAKQACNPTLLHSGVLHKYKTHINHKIVYSVVDEDRTGGEPNPVPPTTRNKP